MQPPRAEGVATERLSVQQKAESVAPYWRLLEGGAHAPAASGRAVNWLSILLVGVIALITWRAFTNGFVRELVSLCVTILAIPIAGIFYDDLYKNLSPIITNDNLALLVSFLAILAGVIILGQIAAHLLKRTVALLNLGGADRVVGGLFGFLKIVIICQVVLIALVKFPSPDLQGSIDDSPVARELLATAPAVLAFLPNTFDKTINGFLDGVAAAKSVHDAFGTPGPKPSPTP
jgi:membrane protein required for colicin V production